MSAARCVCAHNNDGSVTTFVCPVHADQDPCQRMAMVTGKRRKGTIRAGVCTACGWTAPRESARVTDADGWPIGIHGPGKWATPCTGGTLTDGTRISCPHPLGDHGSNGCAHPAITGPGGHRYVRLPCDVAWRCPVTWHGGAL